MGILDSSCNRCGSKEHASENCPHGFLSYKCSHCGSVDHPSSQCPHGIFSSKCSNCGSTEHNSSSCPHGFFSSKCSNCGSREHSSSQCPHGILTKKCGQCGSKNHATSNCPQGALGGLFRGTGNSGGASGLIAIVIMIFLVLALFSTPFKLIDPQFSSFDFKWFDFRDVWVFCLFAWLSGAFIIYLISKALGQLKGTLEERFSNPYLSFSLSAISISTFSQIFFYYRFNDYYILYSILADLLILGVVFLFVRFAPKNKKLTLIAIPFFVMILPFIYTSYYSVRFPVSNVQPIPTTETDQKTFVIKSESGANLRKKASKKAYVIEIIPNDSKVIFLQDSTIVNHVIWYKVMYNGNSGWISSTLIQKN